MRSIKSAEWIRPQCRCKEKSPLLESASERKLKNAEERNKRTLSPKEDAELRSERDETARRRTTIGTGERANRQRRQGEDEASAKDESAGARRRETSRMLKNKKSGGARGGGTA